MTDRTRPDAQPLRSGDPTELGRYEICGRLGEGGQGTVYLGRPKRTDAHAEPGADEYVAVKLLHGGLAGDESARARFVRELDVAKRVARFCTAQVLDADVAGDRPYIVSEYVPGPSLRHVVRTEGPRTGGALERLAINTLTALIAIHQAGIVHRDFKPQNVLMGPDGPRVIDFGVARALGATGDTQTVGTPAYMSPEHFTDDEVGTASDMFAWGTTMVFAATGRPAFGNDEMGKVMHRILTAEPDLGDLSGPLRDLVVDCLAKDPAARPTAREAQERLVGAVGGRSAATPAVPPSSERTVPDGTTQPSGDGGQGTRPQQSSGDAPPSPVPPQGPLPPPPPPPVPPGAPHPPGEGGGRKRRLVVPVAAAAAVAAVLAGGAAWAAARPGDDERRASASEQHDEAGGGHEAQDGTAGQARGSTETNGRRAQGQQNRNPASPNQSRTPGTPNRPGTPPPGGGGSGGGGGGGGGSTPAKEPPNKYNPQQVCNSGGHGGGYYVQRSLNVPGGIAYLLYNSSTYNCAVMLKTKNVGKPSAASVWIQKQGGSRISDSGNFSWYAGPVYVKAPGTCVRFGGNGASAPYGNCG